MALKTDRTTPTAKPSRTAAGTTTPAKPASKPAARPTSPAKPAAKVAPPAVVTLKHLAAQLADTHAMPKKQAETVVDDVIGLLVVHLKAGDRLRLAGFGTLEVKNRPARSGRNPATGAAIQIAASKKIVFRASKELKAAI